MKQDDALEGCLERKLPMKRGIDALRAVGRVRHEIRRVEKPDGKDLTRNEAAEAGARAEPVRRRTPRTRTWRKRLVAAACMSLREMEPFW